MKISRKNFVEIVFLGQVLALLLASTLATVSLASLNHLQGISQALYSHPFTVNQAAAEVEIQVLMIRRDMLQAVTEKAAPEHYLPAIEAADALLQKQLQVIKKSFLGDMNRVDQIEPLLKEWRQERLKFFKLVNQGNREQAVALVNTQDLEISGQIIDCADYIAKFSQRTADSFIRASSLTLTFEQTILIIIFVFILIILLGTLFLTRDSMRQFQQLSENETALSKSLERIEDLYEHAPCGYHTLDASGTIVQINDTELSWLGYQREEILGRMKFSDLMSPQSSEIFQREFSSLPTRGFIKNLDLDLLHKDGTVLLGTVNATAIKDEHDNFVITRTVVLDTTERRRAEKALRDVLSHVRTSVIHSIVTAPEGWKQHPPEWSAPLYHWESKFENEAAAQQVLPVELAEGEAYILGWERAKYRDDLDPMSLCAARAFVSGALNWNQEFRAIDRYGQVHWFDQAASLVQIEPGRWHVVTINTDITGRKHAELSLAKTGRALRTLARSNEALVFSKTEAELLSSICQIIVEAGGYQMAWVGFAEHDPEKTVRPIAQYGHEEGFLRETKFSWADTELGRGPIGTAIRTGTVQVNRNYQTNPTLAPWREAALKRGYQSSIALPLKNSLGSAGALSIDAPDPDAFNEDAIKLLQELAGDLTYGIESLRMRAEREQLTLELKQQATHDHLTGAANRSVIIKAMEEAIQAADSTRPDTALLYLDIDGFKEINDNFGHQVGDRFLVDFAQRLKRICRNEDLFGRLGGDEFILLVGHLKMDTDLHPLLNRILRALGEPLMLEDLEIKITASIGCVVIDGNQSSATELIQHAEEAMYLVKSGQRRGFCIADKEIIQTFQTRRNFDSKIRECVQKNRFRLHYQPIVDTESGKLFGAEALLRIQEKDGSMLAASDFITALQRTRFLPIVDEWVLAQTIHTFKEIAKPLLGIQGFRFSVNVSPSILSTKGYAKLCLEQLDQAGVPPDSLMLEIVESNLISAKQGLLENLQILRAKGVKIAVDDFGTGYSNLQQLTTLPIDIIKIDQMFLETSLTKESVKKTLLATIVGIGKSLGYTLIAEGVENQAQAEQVKALGCRYVQGYFYGKPMPIEELLEFAKKQT